MSRLIWACGVVAIALWFGASASAQTTAERCAALVGSGFANTPEAPAQVLAAKIVPRDTPIKVGELFPGVKDIGGRPTPAVVNGMPEFCQVDGYVSPQVFFVLRLPTESWNGKLLQMGCGGYCGTTNNMNWPDTLDALKHGYAVTTTDMGHRSSSSDAKWAYNNLQAKIDFGYRATHVNAVIAKAILAAFYQKSPKYAYFQGCSTGGRQAMVEAQRYPNDFDGIISGAGPIYYATSGFQLLWSAMANLDAAKNPIMKRPQVELLHKAVLDKCDALDGLKDGIISDPRNCHFDPVVLQCKAGATADCLTTAQVETARKIYQGPVDAKGQPIHPGAEEPGSELNWLDQFVADDGPAHFYSMSGDKFRYLSFAEDPGPSWEPNDIDWGAYAERAQTMGYIFAAVNPDLRRFQAHGGKLIAYHGWADQQVTPRTSVNYYEAVEREMGGLKATQAFYRLFMLPGVNHCIGGAGASTVDYLGALENWVENGNSPDMLVGQHVQDGAVAFTRPYFPYPDVARYAGKGDANDAASFKRIAPDGQ